MRLLKLHLKVREVVCQHTLPREQALTLLKLEPSWQITLAEEVMETDLMIYETRGRGLLGKELKWHLFPIRIEPASYDRLLYR